MRSLVRLSLAAALAALAACGPGSGAAVDPSAEAPSSASAVSDFSVYDLEAPWRDPTGVERALGSLGGKVRVVAMVYTHCTHTCPMVVAEMKRLEAALGAGERGGVGFVLVSLDPERDTPARLAESAASMRLDPARWTLLAGDAGAVRELAALLGVRYRAEADGQISHSNAYFVLDAAGRVVHRQEGLGAGTDAALARVREAVARR
ncbi:MAG TPA: SCO family protein [Longimicrobium sp.]|nr:SCO family protein [Longimicrobium sp.]